MIRRIPAALVVAAATALFAVGGALPAGSTPRGPLRVAVSLPAPGFWDGRRASAGGFEAELARALADRLGYDGVRVVDTPFPDIVRGRFDADLALSEVTITPERERVVDFTGPYLAVDQVAVTTAATAQAASGRPAGLRWGVVRSTTGADVVRSRVRPTAPATEFATETEAFAALRSGAVDAVMIDGPIAARVVADSGGALATVGTVPTGEEYGGVLPEGSRLRRRVTSALAALVADGTVARLERAAKFPDHTTAPAFIT